MRVEVETYVDEGGAERLRRFRLDDRVIEVVENIDQWHGVGYRYVTVGGRTVPCIFCVRMKFELRGN